jgi:hypothetical protein
MIAAHSNQYVKEGRVQNVGGKKKKKKKKSRNNLMDMKNDVPFSLFNVQP